LDPPPPSSAGSRSNAWVRRSCSRFLPTLRDRTGEAVGVGVGDEVAVLVQVPSVQPLRYDQKPGARNPIHVCAMGKALLAFGDERTSMVEPFRRYTPATITTRVELDAELDSIRRRG
jgi:IclR family acetate operon transcriptional repressor